MVVLRAFGGTGVLIGTVGVLQSTGWYRRYYGVIEEYCRVQWDTFGYGWVLLGVGGYWVGEY